MTYPFVDASDDDDLSVLDRDHVEYLLDRNGAQADDIRWLTDQLLLLAASWSVDPVVVAMSAAPKLGTAPNRNAALVELLSFFCEWRPRPNHDADERSAAIEPRQSREERLREHLPAWLSPERAIDFDEGLATIVGPSHVPLGFLVRKGRLVRRGRVHPLRHLTIEILARARWEPIPPLLDPRTPFFWLENAPVRTIVALASVFAEGTGEAVSQVAESLGDLFDQWVRHRVNPRQREGVKRRFDRALVPSFRALEQRVNGTDDLALLSAYWRIGFRVAATGSLSLQSRRGLLESARNALGRLRPRLRQASTAVDAGATFERDFEHYSSAVDVLAALSEDGIWPTVKVLLLALRELPVPAVASDLRYWHERFRHDEQPPRPWCWIPQRLTEVVHLFVRREQQEQPDLHGLRAEFAEFCLDRLGTREGDRSGEPTHDDMVERSPVWRACYVRALRELRVNPRGKRHRRLEWLAKHDPDPVARREASRASEELRHSPTLPPGMSPRRPLLAAFWQLRQAQFLAPAGALREGVSIDEIGAKRTRQKEVQRTSLFEHEATRR